MIRRSIFIALLALAGTGAGARGQSITSPYDFVEHSQAARVFGSYIFTDRGAIDIGPGSSYAVGAGYNVRVSGPFTIDLRAQYMPTSRRVYDLTDADSATVAQNPMAALALVGEADLSLLLMDAALRFDLTGPRTWYRLQPFALIGVGGVLEVSSDNSAEDALPENTELRVRFRNGFTGNVGAGIEWHPSERLTLVAEARDVLWKVHVPDGFFAARGLLIDSEEWVQTVHVSVGLAFRF